jgi:hypothetical protein
MQHSEILHRFFDEGLEEPLEDVLFGQMALDPELRREFVSHLKLHSIIQEDVAGITTPSHVSRQLFTTLGLNPPEMSPPVTAAARLRGGAGAALVKLRSLVVAHRQHLYTAVITAVATTALLLNFTAPRVELVDDSANPAAHIAPGIVAPSDATPTESAPTDVASTNASPLAAAPLAAAPLAAAPLASAPLASAPLASAPLAAAPLAAAPLASAPLAAAPLAAAPRAAAEDKLPAPLSLSAPLSGEKRDEPLFAISDDASVQISEVPAIDPPWLFSQPGPSANLLSNMVVELRKYYGQSFPEVDLPHNSFNVFENMAISVVYKTTEHHAFGFEYGRENFGREFQRSEASQPLLLNTDPSSAQIYRPPSQWVAGPQRENRMLDLFGAVWKLSLPEYGIFDLVYPYLRTFVGATKLGPLGKVRAGLEMYPSNFSMLNIGVEGGMLRYTVDDMSYYTAKLNFTFGVAIGF